MKTTRAALLLSLSLTAGCAAAKPAEGVVNKAVEGEVDAACVAELGARFTDVCRLSEPFVDMLLGRLESALPQGDGAARDNTLAGKRRRLKAAVEKQNSRP